MFDQSGRLICQECATAMLIVSILPGEVLFQCTNGACLKTKVYEKSTRKQTPQKSKEQPSPS
jgi:hypothetical protein